MSQVDLKQRRGNLFLDYLDEEGKAQEIRLIDILFHVRAFHTNDAHGLPMVWSEITLPDQDVTVQ